MLVLTRRLNESIILTDRDSGKTIEIKVVETKNSGRLRIGIEADPNIVISRREKMAS